MFIGDFQGPTVNLPEGNYGSSKTMLPDFNS